jgi:hypothetical protein
VKTEIGAHTNQVRQSTREKSKTKFYKSGEATSKKASSNEQIGFILCLYEIEKPEKFILKFGLRYKIKLDGNGKKKSKTK